MHRLDLRFTVLFRKIQTYAMHLIRHQSKSDARRMDLSPHLHLHWEGLYKTHRSCRHRTGSQTGPWCHRMQIQVPPRCLATRCEINRYVGPHTSCLMAQLSEYVLRKKPQSTLKIMIDEHVFYMSLCVLAVLNIGPISASEAYVSQPLYSSSEPECQDCLIYTP